MKPEGRGCLPGLHLQRSWPYEHLQKIYSARKSPPTSLGYQTSRSVRAANFTGAPAPVNQRQRSKTMPSIRWKFTNFLKGHRVYLLRSKSRSPISSKNSEAFPGPIVSVPIFRRRDVCRVQSQSCFPVFQPWITFRKVIFGSHRNNQRRVIVMVAAAAATTAAAVRWRPTTHGGDK